MRVTHTHHSLDNARLLAPRPTLAEPKTTSLSRPAATAATDRPTARPPRSGRKLARTGRPSWRLVAAELAVLAVVLMAAPPMAHAAGPQIAGNIDEVLSNIRNWLMGVLAGLATIFFSVGGVRYLMAGGDPGEVEKAKTAWKAAGIGYCGAALAPLIVAILQGLVA